MKSDRNSWDAIVIGSGMLCVSGVNYFFRWRQSFLPVLSLHHWSTIAQSDAKGVRSSVSEICRRFHGRSNA
jgi:hypothetical protein